MSGSQSDVEPVPAGVHVQETPGLVPTAVKGAHGSHWSLGSNFYLARGLPVPPSGATFLPSLYNQNLSHVPEGCATQACEPMEFCASMSCPHGTVPMKQGGVARCAGPGPL